MNDHHNKNCCCNCTNLITIKKHPGNNIGKVSILETFGYACTAIQKSTAIFHDTKHGECELHELLKHK
jgi:hypothetical protein